MKPAKLIKQAVSREAACLCEQAMVMDVTPKNPERKK